MPETPIVFDDLRASLRRLAADPNTPYDAAPTILDAEHSIEALQVAMQSMAALLDVLGAYFIDMADSPDELSPFVAKIDRLIPRRPQS